MWSLQMSENFVLEPVAESVLELTGKLMKMIGKILVEKKVITQMEWEDQLFNAMSSWVEGKKNVNERKTGENQGESKATS